MKQSEVNECKCRLRDCGFSLSQTIEYLELVESGSLEDRISLLKRRRNEALHVIHTASKQIDCIDYCIHQLEQS